MPQKESCCFSLKTILSCDVRSFPYLVLYIFTSAASVGKVRKSSIVRLVKVVVVSSEQRRLKRKARLYSMEFSVCLGCAEEWRRY